MADIFEIQGELLALRCYLAALIQVLPLSSQLRLPTEFERRADLVRDQLSAEGAAAFDRAAISLAAKRPSRPLCEHTVLSRSQARR